MCVTYDRDDQSTLGLGGEAQIHVGESNDLSTVDTGVEFWIPAQPGDDESR